MSAIIFILLFILGGLTCSLIKSDLKLIELLGFSLPIGLGMWSFYMFVLDIIGISVSNGFLLGSIILIEILACVIYFKLSQKKISQAYHTFKVSSIKMKLSSFKSTPFKINLFYVLLLGLSIVIIFTVSAKALFWPIINFDSIYGYDLLAKVLSAEGHLNNSIFSPENPMYSVRCLYPPLPVHALSISYIFGSGHSKIIAVIFLISTMVSLYALVKNDAHHTSAILAVFICCITPEFMGQSALVASNPICACYLMLSTALFYQSQKHDDRARFYLAMLSLSFAIWTRSEAVIFAAPMGLLLLKRDFKSIDYAKILILTIATLLPFITWQLYLKWGLKTSDTQPILTSISYDGDKLGRLIDQISQVLGNTAFYGYTLYLILGALLLNLIFFKKAKSLNTLSFILFASFVLYIFVYYQIDTDYNTITKGSWIGSGFKRGMFYFIPIGCFYIANSYVVKRLLE